MLQGILGLFVDGFFKFILEFIGTFQAKTVEVVQDDKNAPVFTDVNTTFDSLGL